MPTLFSYLAKFLSSFLAVGSIYVAKTALGDTVSGEIMGGFAILSLISTVSRLGYEQYCLVTNCKRLLFLHMLINSLVSYLLLALCSSFIISDFWNPWSFPCVVSVVSSLFSIHLFSALEILLRLLNLKTAVAFMAPSISVALGILFSSLSYILFPSIMQSVLILCCSSALALALIMFFVIQLKLLFDFSTFISPLQTLPLFASPLHSILLKSLIPSYLTFAGGLSYIPSIEIAQRTLNFSRFPLGVLTFSYESSISSGVRLYHNSRYLLVAVLSLAVSAVGLLFLSSFLTLRLSLPVLLTLYLATAILAFFGDQVEHNLHQNRIGVSWLPILLPVLLCASGLYLVPHPSQALFVCCVNLLYVFSACFPLSGMYRTVFSWISRHNHIR